MFLNLLLHLYYCIFNIWDLQSWFCHLSFLVCSFLCVLSSFLLWFPCFFLELSVRTIRASLWCGVPLERIYRIITNLAVHLINFYACSFSIHTESINVVTNPILSRDSLVITNSQGDLFFLIPRVKSCQILSFPEGKDCLSFTLPLWNPSSM